MKTLNVNQSINMKSHYCHEDVCLIIKSFSSRIQIKNHPEWGSEALSSSYFAKPKR